MVEVWGCDCLLNKTYEVMLVGLGLEVLLGSLNEHNNVRECSNGVLGEGGGM